MALQLGDLREALIEAGASPEKPARRPRRSPAYENQLAKGVGGRPSLDGLCIEGKLAVLDGRVNLVQRMLGFDLGATVAIMDACSSR